MLSKITASSDNQKNGVEIEIRSTNNQVLSNEITENRADGVKIDSVSISNTVQENTIEKNCGNGVQVTRCISKSGN